MLLSAPVFDGHIMFLRPRALNHTADADFKKKKAYSEVVTNQGLGIHILMPCILCIVSSSVEPQVHYLLAKTSSSG